MPPTIEYRLFPFVPKSPDVDKSLSLPRSAVADPIAFSFGQLTDYMAQLVEEGWTVLQIIVLPVGVQLTATSAPPRGDNIREMFGQSAPQVFAGGMVLAFGVLVSKITMPAQPAGKDDWRYPTPKR